MLIFWMILSIVTLDLWRIIFSMFWLQKLLQNTLPTYTLLAPHTLMLLPSQKLTFWIVPTPQCQVIPTLQKKELPIQNHFLPHTWIAKMLYFPTLATISAFLPSLDGTEGAKEAKNTWNLKYILMANLSSIVMVTKESTPPPQKRPETSRQTQQPKVSGNFDAFILSTLLRLTAQDGHPRRTVSRHPSPCDPGTREGWRNSSHASGSALLILDRCVMSEKNMAQNNRGH